MIEQVLIVDDSPMDRFVVEKMIERAQLTDKIIQKELATEALAYIRECISEQAPIPQVIFLDINMPEMSGFEFLDAFNLLPEEHRGRCSVVMLSSSLNEEDYNKAMSYECVKMYCSKPLNQEKIAQLRQILFPEA